MILLTGATGYLGSHLLHEFLKQGRDVLILKRKNSNIFRLADVIDRVEFLDVDSFPLDRAFDFPIEYIVHTATTYGRKGESRSDLLKANVLFPLALAELGAKYGIKAFYNTSTSLSSEVNNYALSKRQFEDWLKPFSASYKVINILPQYFFGQGDDTSKFVSMLIDKMSRKEESIALSACTQKRDFIYIDDVVMAYWCLLQNEEKLPAYGDFEIGSGRAILLKELVFQIADLMGYDRKRLNFGAIPLRDSECMYSVANNNPLMKMGWNVSTSLETGLRKTINQN